MEDIAKKFRLNHKIHDTSFNVNSIEYYELLFMVEHKNLRVSIMDTREAKCVFLEDYKFSQINTTQDLVHCLEELSAAHSILQAGYWKTIKLCFRNENFTFIPEELFVKENSIDYLTLNESFTKNKYYHFSHTYKGITCVFVAEALIVDWFRKVYPNIDIHYSHQAEAVMIGALNTDIKESTSVHVCVENRYMNLLVLRDGKPLLSNVFHYQSPQDFAYFILFVYDELKLDINDCPITLYGEISPDSNIFALIYKYIRHVHFATKPAKISFSHQFDEILTHRYFDLYSMYFLDK